MEKTHQPGMLFTPNDRHVNFNFQTFYFDKPTVVFIPKGQYISQSKNQHYVAIDPEISNKYRFLFSHIISLGHVETHELKYDHPTQVLDDFHKEWLKMNPFNSSTEELDLIFKANDWLEKTIESQSYALEQISFYRTIQQLSKQKLRLTLLQWKNLKLTNLARKKLYETKGSVKETSYVLGFKDPSYFCRFFKRQTQQSPGEFLSDFEDRATDTSLLHDFRSALSLHYKTSHKVAFYANLLNQSPRTFNRKIQSLSGLSPKDHIIKKLLKEATAFLQEGESVKSATFHLGFEEVSHFSQFYKQHTGISPSKSPTAKKHH